MLHDEQELEGFPNDLCRYRIVDASVSPAVDYLLPKAFFSEQELCKDKEQLCSDPTEPKPSSEIIRATDYFISCMWRVFIGPCLCVCLGCVYFSGFVQTAEAPLKSLAFEF